MDIGTPQGNAGNLGYELSVDAGKGRRARPGSGHGQCCECNQRRESVLPTAPTSLGCTSYPLPAPVVDFGPAGESPGIPNLLSQDLSLRSLQCVH